METSFIEFFKIFRQLNYNDLIQLYKITRIRKYKVGDLIVKEGDYYPYAIGVIKGLVRTYMLKSDGQQITVRLVSEKDMTGSSNCILNDKPSTEYLEAVENCTVLEINMKEMNEISKNNIRLLHFWKDNIVIAFNDAIKRISFYLTKTPEERYQELLNENPKLVLRVPQKHLASYIGVTTVSLSRIRSRIRENL